MKIKTIILGISLLLNVVLLCSAMGCSPAPKKASHEAKPSCKPGDLSLLSDVFGRWKVIKHFEYGISAIDKIQANAWIGREIFYERTTATFGTKTCSDADYAINVVDADQYLLDEFHIEARAVGINSGKVHLVEV
jgi:hypothetical protein